MFQGLVLQTSRNRNHYCRKRLLIFRGINIGAKPEIPEILSRKYGKSQFHRGDFFSKKNQSIFWNFGPKCKILQGCFLISWNYSRNADYLEFLDKLQSIFSKIFKNFHSLSNSTLKIEDNFVKVFDPFQK